LFVHRNEHTEETPNTFFSANYRRTNHQQSWGIAMSSEAFVSTVVVILTGGSPGDGFGW
jgi:hypothetical protein